VWTYQILQDGDREGMTAVLADIGVGLGVPDHKRHDNNASANKIAKNRNDF
jgi:hypothetical protein